MKRKLLISLECPKCKGQKFKLKVAKENKEIRAGTITCIKCSSKYKVVSGIPNFLLDPGKIEAEKQGWDKLSRAEGWHEITDDYLLELPLPQKSVENLQWDRHANNFFFLLDRLEPLKGKHVLDMGSGRCWSSRYLTKRGAEVIALDILTDKAVGLLAAEPLMKYDKTYFERILADMDKLPFKDNSFDIVFFTGTLHHSTDLFNTLSEAYRVLKPGGLLALTNEACGGMFTNELIDSPTEHGINEHTYRYTRYMSYLKKLSFKVKVYNEYSYYKKNKLSRLLLAPIHKIKRFLKATVFVAIAKK